MRKSKEAKEGKPKSAVKIVKWFAGSQQTWNGWGSRETYEDKGVVYDAQTGEALARSRPKTSSSNKPKKKSPPVSLFHHLYDAREFIIWAR